MYGVAPYGLIGSFQALDGTDKPVEQVARTLFKVLLENAQTGTRMWTAFMHTLALDASERAAGRKLTVLESMPTVPEVHLKRLRERVLVLSQSQLKAGGRRERSQLYAAFPAGARALRPERLAARSWASSSSLAFRSQRSL